MSKVNFEDFSPEYLRPKPTARMFGVSDSYIYEGIAAGKFESFLLREKPTSKMGIRLVKISSVRAYFEAEAAKYAKETKAAGGPSLVAAKGREVMAANRARRRKEKEAVSA